MSDTAADLLDRIRKLLRLAQSANQHEASLALEHAVRLAAKHKIDLASLELDPEYEKVIHDHFRVGERLTYITKLVLPIVRDFFHVELVVSRPDVVFAGTTTDVAIASYVLGFLTEICARYLREFEREKKRRPSLSRRQKFHRRFHLRHPFAATEDRRDLRTGGQPEFPRHQGTARAPRGLHGPAFPEDGRYRGPATALEPFRRRGRFRAWP